MREEDLLQAEAVRQQLAVLQQRIEDLRTQVVELQVELRETRQAQLRHEHIVWGRTIMTAPRSLAWVALYWVQFFRIALRRPITANISGTAKND